MESRSCDGEVAEESTSSEIHSTKRPTQPPMTALSRKQKREAQEDKLLEKAVSLMVNGPSTSMAIAKEDDEDTFGRFIVSELRAIADPQIKRLVKWIIQSAIFNVSMPSHTHLRKQVHHGVKKNTTHSTLTLVQSALLHQITSHLIMDIINIIIYLQVLFKNNNNNS